MVSRYLGLVVVPGEYIVRIQVEEFASQVRGRVDGGNIVGAGMIAGAGAGKEGDGDGLLDGLR